MTSLSAGFEGDSICNHSSGLFVENESSDTVFTFNEANLEGKEYFHGLGDGTIGIKDELNNDEFDHLLISFDRKQSICQKVIILTSN